MHTAMHACIMACLVMQAEACALARVMPSHTLVASQGTSLCQTQTPFQLQSKLGHTAAMQVASLIHPAGKQTAMQASPHIAIKQEVWRSVLTCACQLCCPQSRQYSPALPCASFLSLAQQLSMGSCSVHRARGQGGGGRAPCVPVQCPLL